MTVHEGSVKIRMTKTKVVVDELVNTRLLTLARETAVFDIIEDTDIIGSGQVLFESGVGSMEFSFANPDQDEILVYTYKKP